MNERTRAEDEVVSALVELASRATGVAESAIHVDTLVRFTRTAIASFGSEAEVLARASRDDPTLADHLAQAISVGETFFHRHPEHFELVASHLRGRRFDRPVRAWSAGCATGEEAYSLAACLVAEVPGDVEVLGTDLVSRQLSVAETGQYRRWSVRDSGPFSYPTVHVAPNDSFVVRDEVRRVVRFERHNLLEPQGGGPFDVVFCRNVLIYFTPDAAARACEHLFGALAEGGLLVFGTMDLVAMPRAARRVGPPSMQAFTRRNARSIVPAAASVRPMPAPRERAVAPPARRSVPPAPRASRPTDPPARGAAVLMHVQALSALEHADGRAAHAKLAALVSSHPDYVPGLLELAMVEGRLGHPKKATALFERVVERLADQPADAVVDGPEALPVNFYRDTARAWLRTKAVTARGGGR